MLFITSVLILLGLSLSLVVLRTIYRAYFKSLHSVPGPRLAKFTRLWLANAIYSRQYHKISTEIHRQYGPIVRIAPNEYSIDDVDAAQIIYRSRDPLIRVCYSLSLDDSGTPCWNVWYANTFVRDASQGFSLCNNSMVSCFAHIK